MFYIPTSCIFPKICWLLFTLFQTGQGCKNIVVVVVFCCCCWHCHLHLKWSSCSGGPKSNRDANKGNRNYGNAAKNIVLGPLLLMWKKRKQSILSRISRDCWDLPPKVNPGFCSFCSHCVLSLIEASWSSVAVVTPLVGTKITPPSVKALGRANLLGSGEEEETWCHCHCHYHSLLIKHCPAKTNQRGWGMVTTGSLGVLQRCLLAQSKVLPIVSSEGRDTMNWHLRTVINFDCPIPHVRIVSMSP